MDRRYRHVCVLVLLLQAGTAAACEPAFRPTVLFGRAPNGGHRFAPESLQTWIRPAEAALWVADYENWRGVAADQIDWRPFELTMICQFVASRVAVLADDTNYWQTPLQTIQRGTGDCEDFAVFYLSFLSALGCPHELILCVGYEPGTEAGGGYCHIWTEVFLCQPKYATLVLVDPIESVVLTLDPSPGVPAPVYWNGYDYSQRIVVQEPQPLPESTDAY